jgi:hypothetical protein
MKATVSVSWLQEKVKANREKHLKTFEKASVAYRKRVIEIMEKNLDEARAGKEPSTFINLLQPMNQTSDYDRILAMLGAMEWAKETRIELSEEDFKQYVLDQWNWKAAFTANSLSYGVSEDEVA